MKTYKELMTEEIQRAQLRIDELIFPYPSSDDFVINCSMTDYVLYQNRAGYLNGLETSLCLHNLINGDQI